MSTYKDTLHQILFLYINRLITELDTNSDSLVTNAMYRYMDIIYQAESILPSQLAEQAGVSRPAVTKMVKQLLKKGLVEKNEVSRAKYFITLTTKGLDVYNISRRVETQLIDLMDSSLGLSGMEDIDDRMHQLLIQYSKCK